jgi:DHA3 family macrolide efflux protein-like MFS transporter
VWGGFKRRILTILIGILGLSFAFVIIGATPANLLPVAVAAMFLGAILNALCNGSAFALTQAVVPPEMQGRVFTVEGSLTAAASPLAMAIAGPVADAVDIRWLYIVPGILSLVMAALAFRTPAIMHLEDARGGAPAPAAEAVSPAQE